MSDQFVKGTPTPVLLSAQSWKWKHVSGPHSIDVPFTVNVGGNKLAVSVQYNIADDVDVHIDFGSIIKSMFAAKSYPKLSENEMFSISDILLDRSSNTATLIGNVIEKL